MFNEFYVRFYDPAHDANNSNTEEFVGYENGYDIYCTYEQLDDILSQNEDYIDELKDQFGELDLEISGNAIGYISYEIKMSDAETVFDKLCSILQAFNVQ